MRRSRIWTLASVCMLFLFSAVTATADTLFYDGFEGGTGNWTTSGTSLGVLNTFWGAYSLETDNSDTAVRAQSTVGYSNIRVQFQHQTSGLDAFPADYVHLEYSTNGGSSWSTSASWSSNFGWTWRSYTMPSGANDNANFRIRLRGQTNSNNDNGWWDEVVILGDPIQRTLTTNTSGSGSVSRNPNASTYAHGTVVTLTANPSSGWTFSNWSGDLSGSTNPQNITMNANKTVTAVFVDSTAPAAPTGLTATAGPALVELDWNDNSEPDLASYTVYRSTTSGSGYGSIASGVATSDYTDNTASVGVTYYYVVTAIDTNSNASANSNEDSATPTASSYTLSTSVNGTGTIDNTNPQATYAPNETTTLYAIPGSGQEFVSWTGTVATADNPIDITFTQNHTVTANFQAQTPPGPVLGTRVLLVGDSWTNIMWDDLTLSTVFTNMGFDGIDEEGSVTALGGTTAGWWADPGNLAVIQNELTSNPDVDMVHLSMGGNDMLAGQGSGGWYKGMGASAETTLLDNIQDDIQTVIDGILAVRPEAHIVICSYDYLNLQDTLNVPANALMWQNVGSPSARELNEAFIKLGDRQHELALAYGERVTYVNNWGLMHALHGYNEVFAAGRFAAPWGHPSYPWPKSMGANNGDDPIHLNADGFYELGLNLWLNFYRYLIDPAAGPLPEDADSWGAPPPANYANLFSDGFEDTGASTANWTLTGTTFATLNTLWGAISLETDNGDTAIRAQSTAGYENIRLTLALKTDGYDVIPADTFYVDYTTNFGSTWNTLNSWTTNFDWSIRQYLLPATADNNGLFGIRLRSATNSNGDNAFIDEVYIDGTPLPCTVRYLTPRLDGQGTIDVSTAPDYGNGWCDGTQISVTATPYDGWTFTGWSGAATGTTNPVTVTMDANKTLVATFEDSEGRAGLTPDQLDWMKLVSWGVDVDALSFTWPEADAGQRAELLAKANEAEANFQAYHMPYGQAGNAWYTDFTRTTVAKWETIGDSAYFLGLYLGGLANKYDVTGDSATLTEINEVLDTIDMLTKITGKDGYIARFAGLTSDPAYQAYYTGYGNGYDTGVAPWTSYTWLDYSSRDTYIGTAFGLGNVWAHVSDSATRAKCQTITERILDTLIDDGFNVISPNGPISNFTFGFMTIWQRLGITMNNAKYGSQYNYGSSFWWWEGTGGMDLKDMYQTEYFSTNLTVAEMYIVRLFETNTDKINKLDAKLLDAAESDGGITLNAYFSACFGATGFTARNVPRGNMQGALIDYQSGEKWLKATDQSANPAYFPHANAEQSVYALLMRDRPVEDWMWQRAANILEGGFDGIAWEWFALDQFVPYWMGRNSGLIPAP